MIPAIRTKMDELRAVMLSGETIELEDQYGAANCRGAISRLWNNSLKSSATTLSPPSWV